jgi:peroxiredoxin Q/BCP
MEEFEVAYFTASCDTAEVNAEFAKSLDLEYPILSDPDKEVARDYGVVHEGRDLPERWTFYIGFDGKILYVDKEVKAMSHGADIAARLEELGVEKKKDDEEK